jgi:hypothetical protein
MVAMMKLRQGPIPSETARTTWLCVSATRPSVGERRREDRRKKRMKRRQQSVGEGSERGPPGVDVQYHFFHPTWQRRDYYRMMRSRSVRNYSADECHSRTETVAGMRKQQISCTREAPATSTNLSVHAIRRSVRRSPQSAICSPMKYGIVHRTQSVLPVCNSIFPLFGLWSIPRFSVRFSRCQQGEEDKRGSCWRRLCDARRRASARWRFSRTSAAMADRSTRTSTWRCVVDCILPLTPASYRE